MNSKYTSLAADAVQWRQRHSRMTWAILAMIGLFLVTFLFHDDALDRYYGSAASGGGHEANMLDEKPTQGQDNHALSDDSIAIAPKDLRKAVNRAEQLWENNVKKRKEFINEKGGLSKMSEFSDKAHSWGQAFTLWDIYVPSYPCPWEVERVGRMADGGKYTCGLPRIQQTKGKKCVVYSFGVERESSWEAEILERTDCEIFMYDYSVTKFGPQLEAMDPEMSQRAHFFQIGVGDKDEMKDGHQFHTLTTLMKNNGHDWIDIFKIDVEGAEFKILPDIIAEFGKGNLPFSQMLLEIHAQATAHPYDTADFGAWWDSLEEAGLRAFSSELNYPAIHWNPFPTAMEMNFLNTCNGRENCGTLLR